MERAFAQRLLILLLAATLAGCSVIGGVFKAGMAAGIIIVLIILVGVFMLFRRR